jgi:3-hydroxymyristoyl/3-hydroxydecanoyl-(acyl carrier protein) dehydratase
MPEPADLIPHRAPWLVLDRVLDVNVDAAVAQKRLAERDPFVAGGALAPLFLVELSAQTAACLVGAERQAATGEGGHAGYLVSAGGWKFPDLARAGDTLTLTVRRRAKLGALASFHAEARVGERLVGEGNLACAARFE